MRPCFVVEIQTPKKVLLNGLWFGPYSAKASKGKPKKPKRCVVWVHGLGSSVFSKHGIVEELADEKTAVLMFNNRGHDKVASVRKVGGRYMKAGAVHERFTDCTDDIQGAINFARRRGVKQIFLAGHSTGCQKSVYWARKKGRGVKGIILLGPMSDYDGTRISYSRKKLARALALARSYVRKGKGNELLPSSVWGWPWLADAQRFISLYQGKGAEEIFTYWNTVQKPHTLASVRIPILVLLAEKEEFTRMPAKKIAVWFERYMRKGRVAIIPHVRHSFRGGEKRVAQEMRKFLDGHI